MRPFGICATSNQLPNYDIYPKKMLLHFGAPVLLHALDPVHCLKLQVTLLFVKLYNYCACKSIYYVSSNSIVQEQT